MNINKLNWGKCPRCGTTINGWKWYPGNMIQENNGLFWNEMNCPSCKEPLLANMKVEVTIELEKDGE